MSTKEKSSIVAALNKAHSEAGANSFALDQDDPLKRDVREVFRKLGSGLIDLHNDVELPDVSSVIAQLEICLSHLNELYARGRSHALALTGTSTEGSIYLTLESYIVACGLPNQIIDTLWERQETFEQ